MANDGSMSPEVGNNLTQTRFKEKFGLPQGYALPKDTVRVLESISSDNPTVRPVVDESPSPQQMETWKSQFVNLFSDKTRATRVAHALLDNLVRVDEFHFEQKLLNSFDQALGNLNQEDTKNMAFIYYSEGKERSTPWVINILRDYYPKEKILNLPVLDYYDKKVDTKKSTGIIIDDASYSGQQVRDHIHWGKEKFDMIKFYVIVPFMSQTASDIIRRTSFGKKVLTSIYNSEEMTTLDKILGEDDFKWLKQATPFQRLTNEQTTTYFAHKVPDYRSFCPYIGDTRDAKVENHLDSLVPKRPAVYHKDYFADLRNRGKL